MTIFFATAAPAFRDDKAKLPGTKAKPRSRLRLIILLGIAVLLGLGIYRFTTERSSAKKLGPSSAKPRRSRSAWPLSAPEI